MQTYFRLALIPIMVALSAVSLAADPETEIRQMMEYFEDEWNEGELDSIKGHYHKDFVLVTSKVVLTKEQRVVDLEMLMDSDGDHGELEFSGVQVELLGDKHALVYGQSSLEFKDGTKLGSMFSSVYVKTPFGWKALMTHE